MPDRFEAEPYADPMRAHRRRREEFAEPFLSYEAPCCDCGHPLSQCVCNIPDDPVCPDLYPALIAAKNVWEIHTVCVAHRLTCVACGARKQPGRETGPAVQPAKKAA